MPKNRFSINRTILELKWDKDMEGEQNSSAINRTILELKLSFGSTQQIDVDLLIEPFWN